MIYSIAADDVRLSALLANCGLPTEDLGAANQSFLGIQNETGSLTATGGLEFYGDDAILRSLAVDAEQRGSGLAGKLLDELIAEARKRKLNSLYLLTETAEAYFAKRGFQVISRSDAPAPVLAAPQFAGICPDSATAMQFRLSNACAPADRGDSKLG